MAVNITSLHARLLNIARARNMDFQVLLNRLASEQFLYRLSQSSYSETFIFKGGSLLTYLIESDRKTKDLDFSITKMSSQVKDVVSVIDSVLRLPVDDGFEWKDISGEPLAHPDLAYPGTRVTCRFFLGKMQGVVRLDVAIGDTADAQKFPIKRLSYKNESIFGEPFLLLAYTPEAIFSEKLQISVKKRGQNTRMKDYYDLLKLIDHTLDQKRIKKCLKEVFLNRDTQLIDQLNFEETELTRLQIYWEHFLRREKITEDLGSIRQVIGKINTYLGRLNVSTP